jgi:hypothetical protein
VYVEPAPGQESAPPVVALAIMVTEAGNVPLFANVNCGIVFPPVVVVSPEIVVGTADALHVIVAPGVAEFIKILLDSNVEQMVWFGILKVTTGAGLTVMVKTCIVPLHVKLAFVY